MIAGAIWFYVFSIGATLLLSAMRPLIRATLTVGAQRWRVGRTASTRT